MKYYPKLKMFKNSSASNTFDGVEARSYQWYVYAYVIDEVVYRVEKSYSSTTSKHISSFNSLAGWNTLSLYIRAPQGLNTPGAAEYAIKDEIAELEEQLTNKRNRNRQQRLDRIEVLKNQLVLLAQLQTALNTRKAA